MKTTAAIARLVFVASLLLAALTFPAAAQQTGTQPAIDLAITNVEVVDVRRGVVLGARTILIADGRIVRVVAAHAGAERAAAEVVDGDGAWVIPGLLDMHAHLGGRGMPDWLTTEWLMPLLIAHGVTGVRDMGSDCDAESRQTACPERVRDLQRRVEAGQLLGPRVLAVSSLPINPPWDRELTAEQVAGGLAMFAEHGVDHLKIYTRLSPASFALVMAEAGRLGLTASGHIPLRVSTIEASNAGMRSIEHARDFLYDCHPGGAEFRRTSRTQDPPADVMRAMVDEHDPAACEAIFAVLVRNDTWYVPTHLTRRMDAFAGDSAFRADARLRYLPAVLRDQWNADADRMVARAPTAEGERIMRGFYEQGLRITGAAHRAGVRVLVGTDGGDSFAFPGSGVHDEMAELVKAGLTPAEALRSATWSGAEFLGDTARLGSVAAGRAADLVLLDANPLEDIDNVRRIRAVVFRGEHLDRARLDGLLEQVEATAARPLEDD